MQYVFEGREDSPFWGKLLEKTSLDKRQLGEGGPCLKVELVLLWIWTDMWSGDSTLNVFLPSLYIIATSKDVLVADVWEQSGEESHWNPHFPQDSFMIGARKG